MSAFRPALIAVFAAALTMSPVDRARPYVTSGTSWSTNMNMQLQLGSSGALIDGAGSWGVVAEDALATWNLHMDRAHFTVTRDSTAPIALGNGLNNVFWASTAYGKPFNDYADPTQKGGTIIALTLWLARGSTTVEADVMFNNTLQWNSYRGPLKLASSSAHLLDFHRVALHEFGHDRTAPSQRLRSDGRGTDELEYE